MIKWIYIVSMWAMSWTDTTERTQLPTLGPNQMYLSVTHYPSKDNGWMRRSETEFNPEDSTFYNVRHFHKPDSSLIEHICYEKLSTAEGLQSKWKAKFPHLNIRIDSIQVKLKEVDFHDIGSSQILESVSISPLYAPPIIVFREGKWESK